MSSEPTTPRNVADVWLATALASNVLPRHTEQGNQRWQLLLAMMYMWHHSALFRYYNVRLMLWRTLMAYYVISRNGEKPFNKFLIPEPDHLREGPSHRDNTSCVKNQVNRSDSFWVTRTNKTYRPKCITLALLSGTEGNTSMLSSKLYIKVIKLSLEA